MPPLPKTQEDFRAAGAAPTGKNTHADPSALDERVVPSVPCASSNRGVGSITHPAFYAALLSGIAGYVDAAGFVSLVGLFPAHLTGEIVGDAIALSSGHFASRAHLWAFPTFIGSVVLAALVARLCRHRGFEARVGLLGLLTLALALFSVSDALAWFMRQGELPLLIRGGFAVAAMGFQNALMRESLAGSCPTTVMTGNLTQVAIGVVDRVVGKLARPLTKEPSVRAPLTPVAGALLVFAMSAVLGGWATRSLGSVSVVLPTALSFALMLQTWWGPRRRVAPAIAIAPAVVVSTETMPTASSDDPWPDVFPIETRQRPAVEPSVERGTLTRIKIGPEVCTDGDEGAPMPARRARIVSRN